MKAIYDSLLKNKVTIKGGLVMQKLSNDARRITQDIDFDFIQHSISDEGIEVFVNKINCIDGLMFSLKGKPTKLNQESYNGKRIVLAITDKYNYSISSKVDIGVHNNFNLEQEDCFLDICFQDDAIKLLINSREQIIVEKIKSLIRFKYKSTRYKDVYDICFLLKDSKREKIKEYLNLIIFNDKRTSVSSLEEVTEVLVSIFNNAGFIKKLNDSNKNWLDISFKQAMSEIIEYFKNF